jgi:hypothetical protein
MTTRKNGSERVLNKEVLVTNFLPESIAVPGIENARQMHMVFDKGTTTYVVTNWQSLDE